ncbi:MAG: amidophosphoribosyltransferase [Chthonomonas sp.]|nr:amidophosphoribosyltransferase [Chthonomonas sp.]
MNDLGWDHPKEECGVFGVFAPGLEAARLTFFGLFALQHRGQESAGISSSDGVNLFTRKDMGLVAQVFTEDDLLHLKGHLAIGHNRYSTTGSSKLLNAQPISCMTQLGQISVAHNGNLVNAGELRAELQAEGIHFDGTNDSEVIAKLFHKLLGELSPVEATRQIMGQIRGAYSCVVLLKDQILGFRDPNGVRPLVAGRVASGHMLASETCAFAPVDGEVTTEVQPGQIVVIDDRGMHIHNGVVADRPAMCMFEFIYFARPDSRMYGTNLYLARERMGQELAKEHPINADIVVPVPDSGIPAALGYAKESQIPFREGMMKSRYIHRTFIQPDQRMREMGVRMKLSPIREHIEGKRVVLVDDSIVRATTTNKIVRLMRESGAAEVHVRITAPPIVHPCYYGIDMAQRDELAAAKWSIEEIRQHLGADTLGYLSIEGAVRAVGRPMDEFCLACFNGDYPIAVDAGTSKAAFDKAVI